MCHHSMRNYRIISVMFWAFPYLLWQAFGHWSGFVVGVVVAVILTAMFNSLVRVDNWNAASSVRQRSFLTVEPQPRRQERSLYQRGYRAEPPRAEAAQRYQAEELQPQYEEMQVPYPQEELPPMEQH